MSRAAQRPAELASVIAQATSFGGPAVAFEIVHRIRDHIVAPLALPGDRIWPGICRETLAFDLPSAGFRINTGFAESPASTMAGLGSLSPHVCRGGLSYRGTASLNPRFLYDAARDHEALLSVGEDPWHPDHTDALLFSKILAELAAAAAATETMAPILLLQSPVAPYRDWPGWPASRSGEPPKISRGAAIRLSVGVDTDKHGGRLALIEQIASIARDYGLRLHLADRRVGRVRGEWKGAMAFAPDRYAERRTEVAVSAGTPTQAMMITFVGPARVGSTASVLGELSKRKVGILAVTVASLQELAFINLVVAVPPGKTVPSPATEQRVLSVESGVDWLVRNCGGSPAPGSLDRAKDYQMCLTGPVSWEVDSGPEIHPLWLQWQSSIGDHASLTVVDDVLSELLQHDDVVDAQLDYCRSRMVGDGRICSAKISVSLVDIPEDQLPDRLMVLCRMTQANVGWKRSHTGTTPKPVSLKVAWRERWLGRVKSTGVG